MMIGAKRTMDTVYEVFVDYGMGVTVYTLQGLTGCI